MTAEALSELVRSLLITIGLATGYALPEAPPNVEVLSRRDLVIAVCGVPCAVRAAFLPDRGVLIDAEYNLAADRFAKSVLLHELIHVLQEQAGAFGPTPTCLRHIAREREAYEVQRDYLTRHNAPTHRLPRQDELNSRRCLSDQ